MTFEEYWRSEYPPLYEVGKAVARAAWEAASLDADEARAENARLTGFVETLAATPCEKYTSGDCQENGRTATAKYAAFRMCYPCQARAARVQAAAPGTGEDVCEKCGQSAHGQGGEYPCPVCGVPTMHDDLQNGCAHRTPVPSENGKMFCKDCGKYI